MPLPRWIEPRFKAGNKVSRFNSAWWWHLAVDRLLSDNASQATRVNAPSGRQGLAKGLDLHENI
jgi:hypothetical protein